MEIKELMVGDYLQNTNGNIGKVIGILPYESGGYDVVMQYSENSTCVSSPNVLCPVPLTPLILEKNGFFLREGIYVLKSNPRLGWYPKEKQLVIHYCTFPAKVEFVHQLQNIMIDFGITDDIKL